MLERSAIENYLIGTDPECFIYNTKTNQVKSAVKIIPGTKEDPHQIKELGPGFAIQTDNILAEFNVPPTDNIKDFVKNINKMKEYLDAYVKGINPDLGILCAASQNVPKSELRSKQAKMFGCDPDYCIYTMAENPKPAEANTTNLRSCGFHIHIGYDNPDIDRSIALLRYLDAYLGVPSILIDKDTERRKLYGKAGCFRLTDYGCEYRTLSSYFMRDDAHIKWIYRQVVKAIDAYNRGLRLPADKVMRKTINDNDEDAAMSLCEAYRLCDDFLK